MVSKGVGDTYIYRIIDIMRKWKRMDVSAVFTEKLSMPEFTILNGIERLEKTKEIVYVSDLVHLFSLSAQAVSKYLRICDNFGWVRRETDAADRRNTKLFLTESGRKILEKCERELTEFYQSLLNEMDIREIENMLSIADRLYAKTMDKLEHLQLAE